MGSWGAGLYSGDFAMDLRSTIRAVSRLPFDPDRLTDIVCDTEASVANNPEDEDYTTFWLVVADQFPRRGIASARAREIAIGVIDTGQDLEMQRRLGRSGGGLEKRRRMLAELRERLTSPLPSKARPALTNPYTTRPDQLKIYGPRGGEPWTEDGWAALVVVERGRAFGFFAWYRPVVIDEGLTAKPDLATLRDAGWRIDSPGTCSPTHLRRMRLERVGAFSADTAKVRTLFPGLRSGDSYAVNDISIANRLKDWSSRMRPLVHGRGASARAIRIDELQASAAE